MAFRALCVAILLSSLPLAGCGTVANLANSQPGAGGKIPFGGVKQDEDWIMAAANGESCFGTHLAPGSQPHPLVVPMLLSAADLPLSLVGDIVTWPYTAAYSWINQPVPVPPVVQAGGAPLPQTYLTPDNKAGGTQTPAKGNDKGKPEDAKPAQLPVPKS